MPSRPSPAAPITAGGPAGENDTWLAGVRQGRLTAEVMHQGYCAQVYAQTGSYEEAGRRLDLHWQTVKANVRAWKERARGGGGT